MTNNSKHGSPSKTFLNKEQIYHYEYSESKTKNQNFEHHNQYNNYNDSYYNKKYNKETSVYNNSEKYATRYYKSDYAGEYSKENKGYYDDKNSKSYYNNNYNNGNYNYYNYSKSRYNDYSEDYKSYGRKYSNYSNSNSSKSYQYNTEKMIDKEPPKMDAKSKTLQILHNNFDGVCNFLLFAKATTPYISKSDAHLMDDIKIANFFKNYERVSAFGLELNYIFENEVSSCFYTPTVSSMEIFISDKSTYEKILSELNEIKLIEPNKFYQLISNYDDSDLSYDKELHFEYNINENLKFIVFDKKIKIEFYETKPTHLRLIFSKQIAEIFNRLKAFDSIDLSKIDKCSWFSILWLPFKSNKQQFMSTSFINYYQFCYSEQDIYSKNLIQNFLEIPLIGILPIKLNEKVWLSRIGKSKFLYKFRFELCI